VILVGGIGVNIWASGNKWVGAWEREDKNTVNNSGSSPEATGHDRGVKSEVGKWERGEVSFGDGEGTIGIEPRTALKQGLQGHQTPRDVTSTHSAQDIKC
jgi:hypothetical protein